MKKAIFYFSLLLLFVNILNAKDTPRVEKGIIDLQQWNFEKDGIISLNGEWEFYWNRFIEDDTNSYSTFDSRYYIQVPNLWNDFSENDKRIRGTGFASYRAKILLSKNEELAIKYLNAATSCEIYVDGKLLFLSGKPDKIKEKTIPGFKPGVITFLPSKKEVEIVLQIANFHHRKGGQWEPILLGTKEQIIAHNNTRTFVEVMFVGAILIIALFNLILFLRYTSEKPSLYFAVFALLISIRMSVTGEYPIFMLGDFNWSLMLHIDYLCFYLAILFFLFYIKSLFPAEVKNKPTIIITSISLFFSLSVLILPPLYFSYGIKYFHVFSILAGIYAIYVLLNARKNKREGTLYFFFGFLILFLTMVYDILKVNEIIFSSSLSPLGLTLFILFQASFLSLRIRKALERNNLLSKELRKQIEEYSFLNKRYEEQNKNLILAKKKAEESDQLKSAFLANMSHEIRTPMNGILGFTNLLLNPKLTTEKKLQFIEIIKKSGYRMLNTVNDLIDISKIETGQVKTLFTVININDQIETLYEFFKEKADRKGIKLSRSVDLPHIESVIKTDEQKFTSILTNLINNAIKFTNEGSVRFGYEIVLDKKKEYLRFFVIDTGIGIPKKRQHAIFNRFEQADIKDKQALEGSGLGLAISKAYVKMLGGRIWLESIEGEGTQFFFTIPYAAAKRTKQSTTNKHNTKLKENPIKRLRIIIVEDNEHSAMFLKEALENISKEIIHIQTGEEAIELCKMQQDIDLILMDIKIPGIDGYETTRRIREFNKDIKIIAQTAYALSGDMEKAIDVGCNDYIAKPFDSDELMEIITNYFTN